MKGKENKNDLSESTGDLKKRKRIITADDLKKNSNSETC